MTTSFDPHGGSRAGSWAERDARLLVVLLLMLAPIQCSRTTEQKKADDLSDLVLGRVAGEEFTVGDLQDKLEYQFRGRLSGLTGMEAESQYRELTEKALIELCWVTLGEKKGYTKDKGFRTTWELSRRYILAERTTSLEVTPFEEPTDEEIETYYRDNISQFTTPTRVELAHVQVSTKKEAESVRAMLARGQAIAEVAARHSNDERTKGDGGRICWLTANSGFGHLGMIPAVNEAAMKLQKGDVSPPVELPGDRGWSVLYALDRTEEGPRPLDDALKETVKEKARVKKHNRIYSELLERMKKEYDYEFNEENFSRYAASLMTEEELFSATQRAKRPEEKIRGYTSILEKYPASRFAAQAQFMIAFIKADELKDYEHAREDFRAFLRDHPEHELSESARWMLENMDKPDPDLKEQKQVGRRALKRP